MKVCLVLISDAWGGAENVVYYLAKKLREKADVILIINNEIAEYFSDLQNVKIFKMSSLFDFKSLITSILLKGSRKEVKIRWNSGIFYFLNGLLRYLYYRRIHKDLLQLLVRQKVDIVHLHLPDALKLFFSLSKELDLSVVLTVHGSGTLDQFRSVDVTMMERGLTKVDKVTCVSKHIGKMLENSDISTSSNPMIIYNGVDVAGIRKESVPRIALKGDFKLLFPGGGKLFKGGDLVVKSLPYIKKEIPRVHLYIAGRVHEKHTLRELVREIKLEQNVTFTGFLLSKRYYQVLSSTDLLVLPSESEAFGIVLLEAMALGKPVVASKVGGIPEVIKNMQNGILTNRNPKSIADAVVYLYKNKEVYEKISRRNLKRAEQFDWNRITDQYMGLYKAMTGQARVLGSCVS